jgi:O-antigen ligase
MLSRIRLNPFALHLSLVSVTVFFLLWGTFFVGIQLPLLVGLLFTVTLIYLRFFGNGSIDRLGLLLLANFFYWIISGLIVGAIGPLDLLNMKLWNGDGRIVIGSLPLLLFALVRVTQGDLDRTIRTTLWMGGIGMGLYVLWAATHVSWLAGAGHPDEFHAFLSSHTGAGTFFGCMASFAVVYGYEKKSLPIILLGLALIGPTFSSGSRESLVGLMAVFAWYLLVRNPQPRIVLGALVIGAVLFVSLPAVMSQKTYQRTYGILSVDFVTSAFTQAERAIASDWQMGDWTTGTEGEGNLEEGDVTALVRVQLWVYASKRFLASPLFGMGWGRFNDPDADFIDASPYLSVAAKGKNTLSPATAHNSYFQLAAESGLIGLLLYLSLWVALYRRCGRAAKMLKPIRELRAYFVAGQGLIVFILACGLTGHALAAPSVMVPTMTLLGVAIAYLRTNLHDARRAVLRPVPA